MSLFGKRRDTTSTGGPSHPGLAARDQSELEAWHETAVGLIERIDLESVLHAIVERAGDLVGTAHGFLYLREPGTDVLEARVGTGVFSSLPGYRMSVGEGLGGRVAATGQPLVVDDYVAWEAGRPDLKPLACRAVVGVPLSSGSEVVGVLGLARKEAGRGFDATDLALITRFARLAALALENSRLYAAGQAELEQRRRAEDDLLDTIARLQRSEEARRHAHEETIRRLGYVAEYRHSETGKHIERMSRLCAMIGRRLGLDEDHCRLLLAASPLHDIGKIAISDEILLKPGALTPDERAAVERHAEIGHRLLAGSDSEVLELAATIALTHHEWFDGTGYPQGLSGEAIPLAGRIASVADVFDALTSDRPYRRALPVDEALDLLRRGRGTQFDPLVLDALFDAISELDEVPAADDAKPDEAVAEKPPPVRASPRERGSASAPSGSAEPLDVVQLQRACQAAASVLREGEADRRTIEECFAALVAGFERQLLVSVYVKEHGRLWLIAQTGYPEVLDGFHLDRGVMARAVRTGSTQFIPDVSRDPDFLEATPGILAELTIPFDAGGGSPQGALNLETVGATLPPEAVTIVAPLARLLGERLETMREGLDVDVATLARLCVHASSLRGTTAIAEFAARTVGRLLELDCVQVDLRQDESASTLASFWRQQPLGLEPLHPYEVQRLLRLEDETGLSATYHLFDLRETGIVHENVRAPWAVLFPLTVAGGTIGAVIGRASARPEFEHDRVESATLFAQHAAALLDVSLALRREQHAAVTDSLTGLLNRRGFDERLHEELDRAARTGASVTLVLADCDNLKIVNDRGGHELGDRMLQSFARFVRSGKRAEDTAARIGGDEFALILPGAPAEAGLRVAERLRRDLRNRPLGNETHVVATFGVATFPADGRNAAELLRAADRALYFAKRAGKNRAIALPADAA